MDRIGGEAALFGAPGAAGTGARLRMDRPLRNRKAHHLAPRAIAAEHPLDHSEVTLDGGSIANVRVEATPVRVGTPKKNQRRSVRQNCCFSPCGS